MKRAPFRGGWISVACSGLALAVALLIGIPSVLNDAGLRRVTGTMADMRKIGTALESHAREQGGYPFLPHLLVNGQRPAGGRSVVEWRPPAAWPARIDQRLDGLSDILSPRHVDRLPVRDRWGSPFLYVTTADRQSYTIVSTGADGKPASVHMSIWYFPDSDRDLVYADGAFLERLEGTCGQSSRIGPGQRDD